MHVGPVRSTSVGWLKLKSANPLDHPVLQPNYLSTGMTKLWNTKSIEGHNHPIFRLLCLPCSSSYISDIDVWEFRQCVKLSREIFAQKAFDPFRGAEVQPGPEVQSDADIDAFIRKKADSAYHPSCTCKMGSPSDPAAVVDSETRVLGLECLRVVDASIMPSIVSGNLNAPTIMMAEKAADIIRGRPALVDSGVSVYQPPTLESQR